MKTALSILALSLALAGCGGHEQPATAPAPRVMQAQTSVIQPAKTAAYTAMPATVVADQQFQAASRLMGYIRRIDVVEGQTVGVGQRLFSIDPVEVQVQADQARAGLQQALDAQKDAKLDHDRFAALLKEEAVTRQQYEKMKLQYDIATSRVVQAQAGLSAAGNQLHYAAVTSPIAGVVTRKLANTGDLAAPGQPVLVVENTSRLQVETSVPEAVLRALKPGVSVRVEVDGQAQAIKATVARVSPAADPVTRLFLVKLNIQGSGLRSGLFARALFPQGEREALSVPAAALVTRAGITGLFVVGADGLAQFRMVRTGETRDGLVEIQAGLSAGEKVVTGGGDKLESGDKIGG